MIKILLLTHLGLNDNELSSSLVNVFGSNFIIIATHKF